jgi:hypothetical protein
MNKKVLTVLTAVILTAGYAQAQLTFGARAGLNLTNIYGDGAKMGDLSSKMKPGLQLGVVAEYALGDAFAIQPGILFSQQGFTFKEDDAYDKTTLNYIQIPINAQYKIDLGFAGLLLQAGPYAGIGLGGKNKWDYDGDKGDAKIKFGDAPKDKETEDSYLSNRMDFGLGLGAGLQFGNIQAGLGYKFGFTELSEKSKTKNNGLALTVTHLFGK